MKTLASFTAGGLLFATLVLRNLEASTAEWVFFTALGTAITAGTWWLILNTIGDTP